MKKPWIVILCAAFIVTLAMGVRQSFGLFLPQMSVDIGISRSDFGLAMALQNLLFGLVQPFVGALADKHGAGRVARIALQSDAAEVPNYRHYLAEGSYHTIMRSPLYYPEASAGPSFAGWLDNMLMDEGGRGRHWKSVACPTCLEPLPCP